MLSLVLQIDLVLGIFVSACLITLLMFYLQGRGTLPADTVLGLLAHGGLATGLVIMAFFPNIRIDLQALLFGDILAVSRTDLAVDLGRRRPGAGGALNLADAAGGHLETPAPAPALSAEAGPDRAAAPGERVTLGTAARGRDVRGRVDLRLGHRRPGSGSSFRGRTALKPRSPCRRTPRTVRAAGLSPQSGVPCAPPQRAGRALEVSDRQ